MRRRYRQVKQSDGSYKLVEISAESRMAYDFPSVFVRPDVNFKSVVDGSHVTSQAKLREHNKRNNVIHQSELGTERERKSFYERKAAERADFYQGTTKTSYGRELQRERKQAIAQAIRDHER